MNQLGPQRDLRQRLLQVVVLAILFVVGTTSPAPAPFGLNLEKAARNLGVTEAQAFLTVTLPQIRPAVISGRSSPSSPRSTVW
ncbi:ABC transporter permease subunit [Salipiger sp. HF18]|uniref:Binding-protein-dependent transport system inner membrane component n=1 Tax=Salipiger thiooxidans TaxID=282683 RepID=A0A1G7G4X4_9RHOB|nr:MULTISPECIES: ABC transporter permease subunit [Salipiger]NIY96525.1 ABC transporter permease subunit [Salipiger sp. HF18]SDE83204.1 Binding-protein-dependent transport system inner membrane component [Salipiger thiooxidans]